MITIDERLSLKVNQRPSLSCVTSFASWETLGMQDQSRVIFTKWFSEIFLDIFGNAGIEGSIKNHLDSFGMVWQCRTRNSEESWLHGWKNHHDQWLSHVLREGSYLRKLWMWMVSAWCVSSFDCGAKTHALSNPRYSTISPLATSEGEPLVADHRCQATDHQVTGPKYVNVKSIEDVYFVTIS